MSPLGNNHPYPDKQCWHHSTKLSIIPSLHSKRFHVVSEQRTRNESQPLPIPLPLAKNGTPSIFQVAKTENPTPHHSSVFLCSKTTRKCWLFRLQNCMKLPPVTFTQLYSHVMWTKLE